MREVEKRGVGPAQLVCCHGERIPRSGPVKSKVVRKSFFIKHLRHSVVRLTLCCTTLGEVSKQRDHAQRMVDLP